MMEFNDLFMNALIEARQEKLRNSKMLPNPKGEVGMVRQAMGNALVRLGE